MYSSRLALSTVPPALSAHISFTAQNCRTLWLPCCAIIKIIHDLTIAEASRVYSRRMDVDSVLCIWCTWSVLRDLHSHRLWTRRARQLLKLPQIIPKEPWFSEVRRKRRAVPHTDRSCAEGYAQASPSYYACLLKFNLILSAQVYKCVMWWNSVII